jgi:hypothetical protein
MKTPLFIGGLLLLFFHGQAGQILTLTGKVIDAESNKPVAFASVGIQGKSLGTITNEEGEFDLHLPGDLHTHRLFITCMGYERYEARVEEWISAGRKKVTLKPLTYQLSSVEVKANKALTAKEIVQQAKHKIEDNYPVEPFMMSAYFRSYMKVNGNYVLYMDAALDIYDKTYKYAPINEWGMHEQVVLHQVRQSHYQPLKAFTTLLDAAPFDENNNIIEWLLLQNAARYRCQALHVGQYTYQIDSLLEQEGKLLYVISAKIKHKKFLDIGRVDNTRQPAYQLFIDAHTYAIHKIIYKPVPLQIKGYTDLTDLWVADGNDSIESYILGSKFEMVVDYKEIEGKMYPHYLMLREFHEDYHTKKRQILYCNEYKAELLINGVQTRGVVFSDERNLMKRSKVLVSQAPAYKKDFWKQYNAIKMTSLDEKLIKDLGGGLALEKQFRNIKSLPKVEKGIKYRYVKRG